VHKGKEKGRGCSKSPGPAKMGYLQEFVIYKLRRKRTNAPTPEAISARLATKVTGSINSGPPFLGSAVIVAVAVEVGTGPSWQCPVPESV
jgi:hypothetical protein